MKSIVESSKIIVGSDRIGNTDWKQYKTKKSIIISLLVIMIYLGLTFIFPSIPAATDSNNGSSGKVKEYKTDFDNINNWDLANDLYDANGTTLEDNSALTWSVTWEGYTGYSGGYAAAFSLRNFTNLGAFWLQRKIPVNHYTQYSFELSFFAVLDVSSVMHPGIEPIAYIGKNEPEAEDDFKLLNTDLSRTWESIEHKIEEDVDDTDYYWFAFGLSIVNLTQAPGQNISQNSSTTPGLYFKCYFDDVEIRTEEVSLDTVEAIWVYLKSTIMFIIAFILIFLAINKKYEPLLLLPIGTGIILTNIPFFSLMEPGQILHLIYEGGIKTGLFPLLIFLGIGAMTDFGPMLANPKTSLLGAAAQFGIFTSLLGAILLGFSLSEASSIGIIGGADGPTAIYVSINMAPHLLGPIAIAAYSYMALVPIIQPPIIHALTNETERKVKMKQMRFVSPRERILFPIGVIIICAFLLPQATPLIGMLMFGNLMHESGVVQRLANAASNELINVVTIFLGVSVGATMIADKFLTSQTIFIILLGLAAFIIGTATGVVFGKIMYKVTHGEVNPMIGAAGVSAVPMAARVVQKEGIKVDPSNHLLMHAMGPNVAGVIGSAVAAGVLLTFVGV
jgi:oxaloacetate decarboxylase beta subunit